MMGKIIRYLILVVTLALLGSCSAQENSGNPALNSDISFGNIIYSYDAEIKMYRDDLSNLAQKYHNDFLNTIIADDVITADEMNEYQRRVRNCYADDGYKYIQTDEAGAGAYESLDGGSVNTDDRFMNTVQRCGSDSGYDSITRLYYDAVRNPDRLDLSPYVVQCFIDHGFVGQSYSVADLIRNSQQRTGPYAILDAEGWDSVRGGQVYECGSDPLQKRG